jgi:Flp pilus assembly protein TadB
MKSLLVLALVAFVAITLVAAMVFKNARARDTLKFMRNVAWAYIAVVVILAIYRLWTM